MSQLNIKLNSNEIGCFEILLNDNNQISWKYNNQKIYTINKQNIEYYFFISMSAEFDYEIIVE